MARLSQHIDIKELNLKKLEGKNIVTVLDFLEEDPEEICNLCELSFKDVIDIRRNILSKYVMEPTKGLEIFTNMLSKAAKIPTGIAALDEILDGGLLTGSIYEICGLSGDGKSQICFQVTAHATLNLRQTVYYIDTKQDFSAARLYSVINAAGIPEKDALNLLEEIKIKQINDIYELITFLHELKNILSTVNCRLVIIDSVPILYTSFLGDKQNTGLDLINYVAALMKQISSEFQIVFLVVNLAMYSYDTEENDQQVESGIYWMEDLQPALGKAWNHVPSTRLLIQKRSELDNSQRIITIAKSTDIQSGCKCIVKITDGGVVSINEN